MADDLGRVSVITTLNKLAEGATFVSVQRTQATINISTYTVFSPSQIASSLKSASQSVRSALLTSKAFSSYSPPVVLDESLTRNTTSHIMGFLRKYRTPLSGGLSDYES